MLATSYQSTAAACSARVMKTAVAVKQHYHLRRVLVLVIFVLLDVSGWAPAAVPTSLAFSIQVFSDANCTVLAPQYAMNYPLLGNTSSAAICVSNVINSATSTVTNLDYVCENIGKDNGRDSLSVYVATYHVSVGCNTDIYNASTWLMFSGYAAICDTISVQQPPSSAPLTMYAKVSCDPQPQSNGVGDSHSRMPWVTIVGLSSTVMIIAGALLL